MSNTHHHTLPNTSPPTHVEFDFDGNVSSDEDIDDDDDVRNMIIAAAIKTDRNLNNNNNNSNRNININIVGDGTNDTNGSILPTNNIITHDNNDNDNNNHHRDHADDGRTSASGLSKSDDDDASTDSSEMTTPSRRGSGFLKSTASVAVGGVAYALAQVETVRVQQSKYLVLLTILIIGGFVSTLTYISLNQEAEDNSNESYDQFTELIYNSVSEKIDTIFQANRALSKAITSDYYFNNRNSSSLNEFPYYSIPYFEAYAHEARLFGNLDFITYAPLVPFNELDSYLQFANKPSTTSWVQESRIMYDSLDPGRNRSIENDIPIEKLQAVVYNMENREKSQDQWNYVPLVSVDSDNGMVVPTLHHSPPPLPNVTLYQNVNMKSIVSQTLLDASAALNDVVISPTDTNFYGRWADSYVGYDNHDKPYEVGSPTKQYDLVFPLNEQPHSMTIEPIFDTLMAWTNIASTTTSTSTASNENNENNDIERLRKRRWLQSSIDISTDTATIVGYLFSVISWHKYLVGSLPTGVDGISVVLVNTCNQTSTYILYGNTPVYIGNGDLHDPAYSHTRKSFTFANSYINPKQAQEQVGHCIMMMDLYASSEYYSTYENQYAIIFTVVIVVLFLLMAFLFLMYHSRVEKRTNKVAGQAARSNKIISSLFPSNVHDRLLAEKEQSDQQGRKNNKKKTKLMSRKLNSSVGAMSSTGTVTGVEGGRTKPSNALKRYLAKQGSNGSGGLGGDTHSEHSTSHGFDGNTRNNMGSTEFSASEMFVGSPIADLFPNTTVFFGDIVGFTAWSSVREPTQVFTLLETLYHAFDEIANRRRIFKVETIGDCYVAVCGLPDPRKDHAVNMSRFARDCMERTWELTTRLEKLLGPDTGDLTMRMGLHSGPVTAGVLRGERSRFQLFGVTVNTASYMESSGRKDKIHISRETAALLDSAGKSSWYVPRQDAIQTEGTGKIATYWLKVGNDSMLEKNSQHSMGSASENAYDIAASYMKINEVPKNVQTDTNGDVGGNGNSDRQLQYEDLAQYQKTRDKANRLIEWTREVLLKLLGEIAQRRYVARRRDSASTMVNSEILQLAEQELLTKKTGTVLEEVKEIIELPEFDSRAAAREGIIGAIELDPMISEQLHSFLTNIANGYRNNPFHNFEHASHVTMSVVKLLSRIVAPSENDFNQDDALSLHDHTYGITSDPLTQFSCVLSAVIHDLDHPGVPNAQLVKEKLPLAIFYKNQSVAEQNSVDIAWKLLMEPQYTALRSVIYSDETEMHRFRQLLVNSVMATDIVDKELKALRNARWEKAFSQEESVKLENERDQINRKATIVIEHLIQASDVAHTMQHWHIYTKWNERFFMECYEAYQSGRAEKDPSIHWYEGEIGFFDFYIIPLAKKLKDCGVFGVSSAEYLNYAMKNRNEWESRGKEVVTEMIERARSRWNETEEKDVSVSDASSAFGI